LAVDLSQVRVQLSERSYDIHIGTGQLEEAGRFILNRRKVSHAVVITDENVQRLYAESIANNLRRSDIHVDLLAVAAGETSKSLQQIDHLWRKMLEIGADRKSVVVAVGGGVVGDLAGFVAATFTRGIGLFQIPTTLLAQVDSSVGGKVGINLPGAKNMVGAFWQPSGVLIDTAVLDSLPDREYRAGLAEVVKYGVILDADFFRFLEDHIDAINDRDHAVLQQVVTRCCQLKADVVAADEREETGGRAVLNYGHTFCHAFETVTGYGTLLHGEAVSIGMLCASRLAQLLGKIDQAATDRQKTLLRGLGLPTDVPSASLDEFVSAMQRDKKVEHGKLRFVLPTKIGQVELVGDISTELVQKSLRE